MVKIRLDPNDVLFSKMVRERDGRCMFCGSTEKSLQCSHFWGRSNKATRFHPLNVEALCFYCHMTNESNKQGFYREYKLKQLGEDGYIELERLARSIKPYTKYEKKVLNGILKEQYKNGEHLKEDWKIVW